MPADMTDGFHLVVEALKLNGVGTIFGVAGIPNTTTSAQNSRAASAALMLIRGLCRSPSSRCRGRS
jgi:thiamine pyrophosphate-dependent acetolactate synthase large subunit-like protein